MAEISANYRLVTMSEDEATVLRFLRKQLPDEVREQWLQMALENEDKNMALLLLLAHP